MKNHIGFDSQAVLFPGIVFLKPVDQKPCDPQNGQAIKNPERRIFFMFEMRVVNMLLFATNACQTKILV
jgi:hypothetical protein